MLFKVSYFHSHMQLIIVVCVNIATLQYHKTQYLTHGAFEQVLVL